MQSKLTSTAASDQQVLLFKLVIIGDANVGKSCLLLRFADDTFTETHVSTIGVDFRFRTCKINKQTIKLQIWDTAGQERYRTVTSAYYRGANGIVLAFDVTSKQSFNSIKDWMVEVSKYAEENVSILLVGNKSDRVDREVPHEHALQYATSLGICYIETSAKNNLNIENAFVQLSKEMIKKKSNSNRQQQEVIKIEPKTLAPSLLNTYGCC